MRARLRRLGLGRRWLPFVKKLPVIPGLLIRVTQYFIGFQHLPKLCFTGFIAIIPVRVMAQGQLAESGFDFLLSGGFRDT